jgi:hypothetical protein
MSMMAVILRLPNCRESKIPGWRGGFYAVRGREESAAKARRVAPYFEAAHEIYAFSTKTEKKCMADLPTLVTSSK